MHDLIKGIAGLLFVGAIMFMFYTMDMQQKALGDAKCANHPGMVYSKRDNICVAGVKP